MLPYIHEGLFLDRQGHLSVQKKPSVSRGFAFHCFCPGSHQSVSIIGIQEYAYCIIHIYYMILNDPSQSSIEKIIETLTISIKFHKIHG